jgi:hypothetical protein
MVKLDRILRAGVLTGIAAFLAAEPALAGAQPVPGPLLGAGLPALAVFAAGYYVIRRRRRR